MVQIRIIPEPHIRDSNFQTRVDYLAEIRGYMHKIKDDLSKVRSLLSSEDKLIVIFDGDVFDRYFSDLGQCMEWIRFFVELNRITEGNVYSVIGNHEITYKRQNLFWMLADVKSAWVRETGMLTEEIVNFSRLIKVVDELVIDKLLILFGHYKCDLSWYTTERIKSTWPDVEEVMLISHNELLSESIISHFKNAYGFDLVRGRSGYVNIDTVGLLPPTDMLKMVYVGHMHKAYGALEVNENINGVDHNFTLQYLASIGRTNVEEVSNAFLERTIPIITVDNYDIDYSGDTFELVKEDVVVDTEALVARREAYESKAEIRALNTADINLTDPLNDLKIIYNRDSVLLSLLINAVENKIPMALTELVEEGQQLAARYGLGGSYGRR